MGLDELLELTSRVAIKLLPILGVAVLWYLIVLLKRGISLLQRVEESTGKVDETVVTLNRQLQSLDKPLSTLNDLSDTVDYVHEASKSAVRSTTAILIENFANIKDWAFAKFNATDTEKETNKED